MFRSLYIRQFIYILCVILCTLGTVWCYLSGHYLFIILLVGIVFFVFFYSLFSYSKIIRKITYFFNAVENEDSTLYYPENTKDLALRDLNSSLNKVNKMIQEIKLQNREQEQYFAALLEQVATGVVVLNETGHILQANSTAKNLLNYNTLTHIVQLKRVDEKLYEAFASLKDKSRQLVKINAKNTTEQLSLQATVFKSGKGEFRLVSVQDIRNELDTTEVESWLKLIRVLTHEIMNSITPITSLSETLMDYYTGEQKNKIDEKTISNTVKGLEIIRERGVGLVHFVESYRKLTRLSPPVLKEIVLQPFIEHLLVLMETEPGFECINFQSEIVPSQLTVSADEAQISQVLINLIKNAMQAVKNISNPNIRIEAKLTPQRSCEISVVDNGGGIAPELLEQIFVPFFTTKEDGSGIGLSLSRQIMRNHGGTIKVFSIADKGSRFSLCF